ncbi:MAG TPA: sugar ABC transporter permease [Chloroflexota bacterium]|nr:sugar ABC transporter permease [Chloroflexota bacterium]
MIARIGAREAGRRPRRGRLQRNEWMWGYLCVLPSLLGFLIFMAGPLIASFALIFVHWEIITPPTPAGLDNLQELAGDSLFFKALFNTAYVTLLSVPLGLLLSLLLALALNQDLLGIRLYRMVFFIPSLTPTVANAILWLWIFNPSFGLANAIIGLFGIPPQTWLYNAQEAKLALVITNLWTAGTSMIIFLAGLRGIPQELYEAAAIDGVSWWSRFRYVTLPMLSPVIFFNLIIGIINSMQSGFTLTFLFSKSGFNQVGAGPDNSLLLLVLYIYNKGFEDFEMGYAALLAWVLFIIILALTILNFRVARSWVFYEGEMKG